MTQEKNLKENKKRFYTSLFFKGMGMGAADIVPGVSGGTVAFITGIYQELIDSLTSFDLYALKLLFTGNIRALWVHINGVFLLVLFSGILTSFFSLTKLICWALNDHPLEVWAYFFGLILASVIIFGKQVRLLHWPNTLMFILAAVLAFQLTCLTTLQTSPTLLFFFLCGAIAICAMILPGISGSFILLLLGMYQPVIEAVHNLNCLILVVFILGCVVGLLSFTNLLSWLLRRFYAVTLATLTGFMVGSLNKVWPWKVQLVDMNNSNVWPSQYQILNQADPLLIEVMLMMCFGLVTVFVINRVSYVQKPD